MKNFSVRSYDKELIDRDDIPFTDIERNMHELDIINTWLGGHAISISGLRRLLKGRSAINICEIGCGGGDNLKAMIQYCRKRDISVQVTGIDCNAHCLAVARAKVGKEAEWILSDYRAVDFGGRKPDIIFSSLFCHHFTDDELVYMLNWMSLHARIGWFINDLHRHPVAYHTIRWITGWFSRCYLVKNDAPLSVLRGFSKQDWEGLMRRAGIANYSIRWKWAFRWLVIFNKNEKT